MSWERYLEEVKKMRFEEAYGGYADGELICERKAA